MSSVQCPRCGVAFPCGAQDTSQPCWCVALPPLPTAELGLRDAGCYCPSCLQARLAEVQPAQQPSAPGAP